MWIAKSDESNNNNNYKNKASAQNARGEINYAVNDYLILI